MNSAQLLSTCLGEDFLEKNKKIWKKFWKRKIKKLEEKFAETSRQKL